MLALSGITVLGPLSSPSDGVTAAVSSNTNAQVVSAPVLHPHGYAIPGGGASSEPPNDLSRCQKFMRRMVIYQNGFQERLGLDPAAVGEQTGVNVADYGCLPNTFEFKEWSPV